MSTKDLIVSISEYACLLGGGDNLGRPAVRIVSVKQKCEVVIDQM